MSHEPSIGEQISAMERQLEQRRERAVDHAREVRADINAGITRAKGWMPLVSAVAAVIGVGIVVLRRQRPAVVTRPAAVRAGLGATMASAAGAALSFALSPQAQALAQAFRAARRHRGATR